MYGVGGALTLLLNKYPEKTITVYGPKKVIQIVKAIVDLFMLKNRNYIEYVEIDDGQIIKRDSYICSVIKTYHTESSVGYCFHFENRKIVLLGDVGLPDIRAKEKIVGSISEADFAVIDGVYITSGQAAELARDAKIKSLYLMPILLDKSEEEVFNEVAYIFINTYIPKDLELFSVE